MEALFQSLEHQLQQLYAVLSQIKEEQYCSPISHLGGASIGAHTRHIVELLQCAVLGAASGQVDYENRQRNLQLETDLNLAKKEIESLLMTMVKSNRDITLVVGVKTSGPDLQVPSNYYREMVYNTEHTIHHLALIRVALIELDLDIVNGEFGVSSSTLKYRNQSQTQEQAGA